MVIILDEDFERGTMGAEVTTVVPGGDFDPVDGNANTYFDVTSLSGSVGHAVFTSGKTGLGITRQPSFGVSTVTKWMPGYDYDTYTADPFTGLLIIECSFKITDTRISSTYALVSVSAQPDDDFEGENETTVLQIVFNPFNAVSTYMRTDNGSGFLVQRGDGLTVPLDVWLDFTLTFDKDRGKCWFEVSNPETSLSFNSGEIDTVAWKPTSITFGVTNDPAPGGTKYVLDDVLIYTPEGEMITYRRVFPRDDGLAGGAPRTFPSSKAVQSSNRIGGGYV